MNYELMFILKPDVSEEKQKAEVEKIKNLITENKGEVVTPRRARGDLERSREVKGEAWGKRVLAYPIKHFSEGFYHLLNFKSTPTKVKELEKKLNLDDEVLRFLITIDTLTH